MENFLKVCYSDVSTSSQSIIGSSEEWFKQSEYLMIFSGTLPFWLNFTEEGFLKPSFYVSKPVKKAWLVTLWLFSPSAYVLANT